MPRHDERLIDKYLPEGAYKVETFTHFNHNREIIEVTTYFRDPRDDKKYRLDQEYALVNSAIVGGAESVAFKPYVVAANQSRQE